MTVKNNNISTKNKHKNSIQKPVNLEQSKTKNMQNCASDETGKNGFIWATIVLSVLLFICVILLCALGFKLIKITKEKHQTLLTEISVEIGENCSSVKAVSLLDNVIAGVDYPQKVTVKSNTLLSGQLLRAKAELIASTGKSFNVVLAPSENWQLASDGYFYFSGVLGSNMEVGFCDKLTLPEDILVANLEGMLHTIVFKIESLSHNLNIAHILWEGAPENWLNQFVEAV